MHTKEHILKVVVDNLLDNLEDVDEALVTPDKSMKDLGATSLDIVEIVSCSMRDLKVKVPRSELADLKNIGELADLLHRVSEEKHAAQAAAN